MTRLTAPVARPLATISTLGISPVSGMTTFVRPSKSARLTLLLGCRGQRGPKIEIILICRQRRRREYAVGPDGDHIEVGLHPRLLATRFEEFFRSPVADGDSRVAELEILETAHPAFHPPAHLAVKGDVRAFPAAIDSNRRSHMAMETLLLLLPWGVKLIRSTAY